MVVRSGAVWLASSLMLAAAADFAREVRPVLEKNCIGCHNPKLHMSGLSLADRAGATKGGRRGPAVLPGKTAESLLLQAVRHEGNLRMPPGRKLAQEDIARLEEWVGSGAAWPSEAIDTAGARPNHWPFLAPVARPLPAVRNAKWIR